MKYAETKKFDYIDAIRGFAILGVVLVHSSQWVEPASDILAEFALKGARGVQLFFIASALTLFLSLDARKEAHGRPILSFFIRRFFRIAPAFYLAIIVYTLYSGLAPRFWAPNGLEWWYIPLTALFIHGWHPETITSVVPGGWSIAVEMTFYLFVPFLFLKLKSIKSTLIALILSLIAAKIIYMLTIHFLSPYYPESHQYIVDKFAFFWFFSQFPIFLLGILVFHIIKKYPESDSTIAVLFLTLALILILGLLETILIPKHYLYGLAFMLFSLSLHYAPHGFLVNNVTILIGRLSFSIYLVHFMVINILRSLFPEGFVLGGDSGFLLAYILVTVLSTGISFLTYTFVEVPGINLGKRIIKAL